MLHTLRDLLLKFNIDLDKDVISVTSDGAMVMVKLGKEISPLTLLCMAHGIHLAVKDCLYKTEISPSNYDNDNDYSDSDSDEDEDTEFDDSISLGPLINKLRKVVKFLHILVTAIKAILKALKRGTYQ